MMTDFVHIVLNESARIILSQALKEAGRTDSVACFPQDLSYGPISPPDATSRLEWMEAELRVSREDWDWIIQDDEKFWSNTLYTDKPRLVWVSRRTAKDYTGFLELIRRFAAEDYRVIHLTSIETPWCRAEDQTNPNYICGPLIDEGPDASKFPKESSNYIRETLGLELGPLTPDRVLQQSFEEGAETLSPEAERRYRDVWGQLRKEGSPLRILKNGILTSVAIDFYDDLILSHVTEKPQRAARVIGETMANSYVRNFLQADPLFLAGRLRNLAAIGRVLGRGELFSSPVCLSKLSESEVQLPDRSGL